MSELTMEEKYTVVLSERMREVMRDPRWTEDERTDLLRQYFDAADGKPVVREISEAKFQVAVAQEYFKQKVQLEAKRKLAADNYEGTEELMIADLRAAKSSFIVQDLVPHDAVCFFIAKSNMGKTFAYLDMVLSMILGLPWLGKKTAPTKTVIVIGEGRNGYIDRIDAWCTAHGMTEADWSPWLSFVGDANLNNDESIARIKAVADREEVGLIIFDTWANVSGTQSEDDAALNSITMNRAIGIRKGVTNFFVHHPRKSDEDTDHPVMRGSGALAGRADVVMTMYKDKSFAPKSGESEEWRAISTDNEHAGKNRHAQTETIRGIYLETVGEQAVMAQIGSESISREARRVSKTLKGSMTLEEFMRASGLKSETTARRYLNQAVEDGVAINNKSPLRNVPGNWELADRSLPSVNWNTALKTVGAI